MSVTGVAVRARLDGECFAVAGDDVDARRGARRLGVPCFPAGVLRCVDVGVIRALTCAFCCLVTVVVAGFFEAGVCFVAGDFPGTDGFFGAGGCSFLRHKSHGASFRLPEHFEWHGCWQIEHSANSRVDVSPHTTHLLSILASKTNFNGHR